MDDNNHSGTTILEKERYIYHFKAWLWRQMNKKTRNRWCAIRKRKGKTWLNVCRSPCSIITRGHCWLVVGNKTRTESVAAAAAGDVVRSGGAVPCAGTSRGPQLAKSSAVNGRGGQTCLFTRRPASKRIVKRTCKTLPWVSDPAFAGGRVVLINKLIHRPTIGWPPATADL